MLCLVNDRVQKTYRVEQTKVHHRPRWDKPMPNISQGKAPTHLSPSNYCSLQKNLLTFYLLTYLFSFSRYRGTLIWSHMRSIYLCTISSDLREPRPTILVNFWDPFISFEQIITVGICIRCRHWSWQMLDNWWQIIPKREASRGPSMTAKLLVINTR